MIDEMEDNRLLSGRHLSFLSYRDRRDHRDDNHHIKETQEKRNIANFYIGDIVEVINYQATAFGGMGKYLHMECIVREVVVRESGYWYRLNELDTGKQIEYIWDYSWLKLIQTNDMFDNEDFLI